MPDNLNNQITGKQNKVSSQESLDVYKSKPSYKWQQRIKWMSPKKKIILFGLPIFAIAIIALILYFTSAAPGDPVFRLELDGSGHLDGQELECGQDYNINIRVDTQGADVVAAGAFIYYDPTKITVNSIDVTGSDFSIGEESITPATPGILQLIDPSLNLVQVIRGQGAPGVSGSDLLLATLDITVRDNIVDPALFRFYGNQVGDNPNWISSFVLADGTSVGVDYTQDGTSNGDGNYEVNIRCCLGDICGVNEICPGNWLGDPIDRCCSLTCELPIITTPRVKLCPGTVLVINTTQNSASFYWCTEPSASCSITITGPGASTPASTPASPDSDLESHVFNFSSLAPDTIYSYIIECWATDYDDLSPPLSGQFKTAADVGNLIISNVRVTDITAYRATIKWTTNRPADTRVFDGGLLESNDRLITSHSIDILGLIPEQTYQFDITSRVNDTVTCEPGTPASAECATASTELFTTLAAYVAPDANIIVKVNRDRICDEWLYCNAAVQTLNTKKNPPQYEDRCFSVGLCNQIDQGGRCANILENDLGALTKEHPDETGELKNLSGYTKAGLDWGYRCESNGLACGLCPSGQTCYRDSDCPGGTSCTPDDTLCGTGASTKCSLAKVDGYYPYSAMAEVGLPVGIPNSNFEEGTVRPWKSHNNAKISNFDDGVNRMLRIDPDGVYSGVRIEGLTNYINTQSDTLYIISFRAKTEDSNGQDILVQVGPYGPYNNTYTAFETSNGSQVLHLTPSRQAREYIMSIEGSVLASAAGYPLNITIAQPDGTAGTVISNKPFYIDNINMKAVLEVADNLSYISRSCRMYPTQNAPACDYYDEDKSKEYKGWKGYCVEADPGYPDRQYTNQPMCLQWWPVDVIQGESDIFSDDKIAGYTGRQPLYYCVEAQGSYPYERKARVRGMCLPHVSCTMISGSIPTMMGAIQGWDRASGLINFSSVTDLVSGEPVANFIHDYDIERIDFKVTNAESNDWPKGETLSMNIAAGEREIAWCGATEGGVADSCPSVGAMLGSSPFVGSPRKYWEDVVSTEANCRWWEDARTSDENNDNIFGIRANFNASSGRFRGFQAGLCDGSGGPGWLEIEVTFYLREPCNVIAQVVTPDGRNVAWANRVQLGGWPKDDADNMLSYEYQTDYMPYGAAVTSGLHYDPLQWPEPLYVMPADTSYGLQAPYQIRAGSPYAISSDMGAQQYMCENPLALGRTCASSLDSECDVRGSCQSFTSSSGNYFDCVYSGVTCSGLGDDSPCQDVGLGACVEVRAGVFGCASQYRGECVGQSTGSSCSMRDGNCQEAQQTFAGENFGTSQCIAGSADKLGKTGCKNNADCGYAGEGFGLCMGIELSDEQKSVIGGGWEAGQEKLSKLFAKSYGVWKWQQDNDGQMKYVEVSQTDALDTFGWDVTNIGVPPRVNHILVDNTDEYDFSIIKQGVAILKFTSWVDANQMPLVRYTVDWKDGTQITEAGLRIAGRDLDNPHIVVHYYKYDDDPATGCDPGGAVGYCSFKPQVQLEDNWGICNGAGDCASSGAWTAFVKEIRVYKEESAPSTSPILSVEPISLTYVESSDLDLPFTQSFTVRNSNPFGDDLEWEIASSMTGFLSSQDPSIYDFGQPYSLGYSGSLEPGRSIEVPFTLNHTGTLLIGIHEGYINITSNGGSATVTIRLDVRELNPP